MEQCNELVICSALIKYQHKFVHIINVFVHYVHFILFYKIYHSNVDNFKCFMVKSFIEFYYE